MTRWLWSTILGGTLLAAGCGSHTVNPMGTAPADLRTSQYAAPVYGSGYGGGYGRLSQGITLVAKNTAILISPRNRVVYGSQHRPEFNIASIQLLSNRRILLQTVTGQQWYGYTHQHGPDTGFSADLGNGETIEGIVHLGNGRRPDVVTWAFVTPNDRVFSGRQEFERSVGDPVGTY